MKYLLTVIATLSLSLSMPAEAFKIIDGSGGSKKKIVKKGKKVIKLKGQKKPKKPRKAAYVITRKNNGQGGNAYEFTTRDLRFALESEVETSTMCGAHESVADSKGHIQTTISRKQHSSNLNTSAVTVVHGQTKGILGARLDRAGYDDIYARVQALVPKNETVVRAIISFDLVDVQNQGSTQCMQVSVLDNSPEIIWDVEASTSSVTENNEITVVARTKSGNPVAETVRAQFSMSDFASYTDYTCQPWGAGLNEIVIPQGQNSASFTCSLHSSMPNSQLFCPVFSLYQVPSYNAAIGYLRDMVVSFKGKNYSGGDCDPIDYTPTIAWDVTASTAGGSQGETFELVASASGGAVAIDNIVIEVGNSGPAPGNAFSCPDTLTISEGQSSGSITCQVHTGSQTFEWLKLESVISGTANVDTEYWLQVLFN